MFDRRSKYLVRDKIRRSINIKYKYLSLLQMSMFHNRYLNKNRRLYLFYYLNSNKIVGKKVKNICNISGETAAVNKKLLMSRFQINYKGILNNLQNFKLNSW